jgi:hypothetical protein
MAAVLPLKAELVLFNDFDEFTKRAFQAGHATNSTVAG